MVIAIVCEVGKQKLAFPFHQQYSQSIVLCCCIQLQLIRKMSAIGYSNTISTIRNYIHVVLVHICGIAALVFCHAGNTFRS